MNIPFFQFLSERIGIKNIDNPDNIYSSYVFTKELNSELIINSNPEPQVFSSGRFNELSIRLSFFRCSSLNFLNEEIVKKMIMVVDGGLPVKIKQYESPWVSISKLPMLITEIIDVLIIIIIYYRYMKQFNLTLFCLKQFIIK